ncbi:acetylglutamate kinase, chloroplastic-like [Dioscorea cayenensis subsp. rotundata]|uniref:Acetylglutamate kinase, chloroplastic-like n=1 Tax=Dioscorea cayennensis subsp. rotundata TaxID=55577 RepID=A0AB40B8U5_DIOCR|nr:acetylglutamate kinase, chloroplastic-like [Dioscorea cayenensis subsp. rotundata]
MLLRLPPLYPTQPRTQALQAAFYVINAHTRKAVKMVLARKINKRLVAEINLVASASGLSRFKRVIMSSSESAVLGIVNDQVSRVDPSVLHSILADGHIPMIASVAADEAGKGYNVNTDIADGEPMVAVRFEKVAMPRM